MQDDGDLALQDHEDHGVLVRAAHTLGAVTLDPNNSPSVKEEGKQCGATHLRNERR